MLYYATPCNGSELLDPCCHSEMRLAMDVCKGIKHEAFKGELQKKKIQNKIGQKNQAVTE